VSRKEGQNDEDQGQRGKNGRAAQYRMLAAQACGWSLEAKLHLLTWMGERLADHAQGIIASGRWIMLKRLNSPSRQFAFPMKTLSYADCKTIMPIIGIPARSWARRMTDGSFQYSHARFVQPTLDEARENIVQLACARWVIMPRISNSRTVDACERAPRAPQTGPSPERNHKACGRNDNEGDDKRIKRNRP